MAKPESTGSGTLLIPMSTFEQWAQGFLPAGPFYALGKPKEKGDNLEVAWTSSTVQQPPEPAAYEPEPEPR